MFNVGDISPVPGNDRRKQLVDALVKQLQQSQAQQGQAASAGDQSFMNLMKRRQPLLPSTPTRSANAGRDTAGVDLTGGNTIPGSLLPSLGPGAVGRGSGYSSPSAGIAAPRFIPGTALLSPGSGAAAIPAGAMPSLSNPVAAAGAAAPNSANPSVTITGASHSEPGGPAAGTAGMAGNPVSSINPSTGVYQTSGGTTLVGQDAKGAAFGSTPSGLLPLGNGMFLNPVTGMVLGGGASYGVR